MNKRELQQQKKQQKQQAADKRAKTQRLLGKVALFVGLPAFLLIALISVLSQGPTYSTVEIVESDHVRGSRNRPVPMVVYADFQCPACSTENRTIVQMWPSVRDKAQLIFRHFPITTTHRHSWTASLYAEAAARQGRFWEMHDLLFNNQGLWSNLASVEDEFDSYALELNLDLETLKQDMESDEVISKIRSDQRGGNSAGVLSTPSVFIDGKMLANPTRLRMVEAINEAYDRAQASNAPAG